MGYEATQHRAFKRRIRVSDEKRDQKRENEEEATRCSAFSRWCVCISIIGGRKDRLLEKAREEKLSEVSKIRDTTITEPGTEEC